MALRAQARNLLRASSTTSPPAPHCGCPLLAELPSVLGSSSSSTGLYMFLVECGVHCDGRSWRCR
eukprot:15159363-Alexandrium_andersonii.AAC.1